MLLMTLLMMMMFPYTKLNNYIAVDLEYLVDLRRKNCVPPSNTSFEIVTSLCPLDPIAEIL